MNDVSASKHGVPVPGITLGTVAAGVRYPNRRDLVVMNLVEGSTAAAVFTTNAFCAAPVQVAREHLGVMMPRYLVINTGNANAGTGAAGLTDARAVCQALADLQGCTVEEVLPFSTGVIGEPLPVAPIQAGLPHAIAALTADGWTDAAHGIMTTDTRPKIASRQLALVGTTVTVTGIAKGAGMICPNMATMLGFVATDLAVSLDDLRELLEDAVADSFNSITIDGDTSTNDACVLLATGQAGIAFDALGEDDKTAFSQALQTLFLDLAQQIVRDGEGATKFITVRVINGEDEVECRQVAYTVAHSPLVKTAFFASDPNWGRILAAVGRAQIIDLDTDLIDIDLNDCRIVERGARSASYTEAAGKAAMSATDIVITIDLHRGLAQKQVFTCDFSHDYVSINADYRS